MKNNVPTDTETSSGCRRRFIHRIFWVGITGMFTMLVFVGRLVQLQVIDHDVYATRSQHNRIEMQVLPPPRGLIYDRHGVLLADNRQVLTLAVVREHVEDVEVLLNSIKEWIGLQDFHVDEFWKRWHQAHNHYYPVTLKRNLNETEIASLAVNRYRFPELIVTTEVVREYPLGPLTAHAVGSVRRVTVGDLKRIDPIQYDQTYFIGRHGVEKFYENALHGLVGFRQVEVDVRRRVVGEISTYLPVSGQNLTLHLDTRLQQVADEALGDRRGAVVALDPNSGGILVLASKPSYNPSEFVVGLSHERYNALANSKDKPLYNRAIKGQYAPGSTVKPLVALAALSANVASWNETIIDNGEFRLRQDERIYRDWTWRQGSSGGHGAVNMRRAIYRSSNVYFYTLSTRLEIDYLAPFAREFGIGKINTIDVADANVGLMPDAEWKQAVKGEAWYPGDNLNISIGQGDILVTPLQLAAYVALLANRGRPIRPHMLYASETELISRKDLEPLPVINGPTPQDWELMIRSMEDVVHRGDMGYGNNGTAWAHIGLDIPYRMAGKSGTVQVVSIEQNQEYNEEEIEEHLRKHAWFIAFAPVENPTIAIAVLVENGGGGSSVAGPIARKVIDAHLSTRS